MGGKLWALKSRLEVPLAYVRGARHRSRVHSQGALPWHPGRRYLSARRHHGGDVETAWRLGFLGWHAPEKAVIIESADERYARLVVEVEDPYATAALITRALGPH